MRMRMSLLPQMVAYPFKCYDIGVLTVCLVYLLVDPVKFFVLSCEIIFLTLLTACVFGTIRVYECVSFMNVLNCGDVGTCEQANARTPCPPSRSPCLTTPTAAGRERG